MKKKELGKGQYVTTGTMFVRGEFKPEEAKIALSEQEKAALLEFLTESLDFHTLVCDITGTERKQVKVSQEIEKLKEDYLYMCERYKQEQVKNKAIIQRWKDETAKSIQAQIALEDSHSHHNNVMNRIKDLLKEVECSSVRDVVTELKAERANRKLLAEKNEMYRRENDKLKASYEKKNEALQALHSTFRRMNDGKI